MDNRQDNMLNSFNTDEKLDLNEKATDSSPQQSPSPTRQSHKSPVKFIVIGVLCAVAASVIGAAILLTTPEQGILETLGDIFVTDSDSLSIHQLNSDVLATGVVYDSCPVYSTPSGSARIITVLLRDTDLLIYDVKGNYFRITDASGSVQGYVKKDDVNTFGIEVLPRSERGTSMTDGNTAPDSDADVNPADFEVNHSPYFIYVEKGSHTITIFTKDTEGRYTIPSATYAAAVGSSDKLTPAGDYRLLAKEAWHSWTTSYSPFCSKFGSGLYFHGPLYRTKGDYGSMIESSVAAIGTDAASGSLRTDVAAAYAIYNCPVGTNIKIVNGAPLHRSATAPSVESQRVDPAIRPASVEDISFGFGYWNLDEGKSFTAWLIYTPNQPSNTQCAWSTDNPAVASLSPVSNGEGCKISGRKAGTAVITAVSADGGHTASFKLTVTAKGATSQTPATDRTSSATSSSEATSDQGGQQITETTSAPEQPPADNSQQHADTAADDASGEE